MIRINLGGKSWVALGLVGLDGDVGVGVDNAGGGGACIWHA